MTVDFCSLATCAGFRPQGDILRQGRPEISGGNFLSGSFYARMSIIVYPGENGFPEGGGDVGAGVSE